MSDGSIPEAALQVTFSVIDEITSEIVLNPADRLDKFEALQYFIRTLPLAAREQKNMHFEVASILTAVTSWDPYDTHAEASKQSALESEYLLEIVPSLLNWSADRWKALSDVIFSLMQKLKAKEDSTLENVLTTIEKHGKLARIRVKLQEELERKSSGPVDIDADLIAEFADDVHSIEDENVSNDLENLLVEVGGRSTRSHHVQGVTLKPIQDLKYLLGEEPLHFKYVQHMVNLLMFKWARDFIPSLVPYLDEENQSQTTPKPRSATKNKPRSATKGNKRTTMEDDDDLEFHAEDEDTDEPQQKKKQATPAKRTPKKARVLYEQVGEAGGVQILEDEEEEDEEDEQSAVATLSKKRKKPVKFTQEEKDAIKDGVETYGKGQWAAIRDSYRVLRHRDYAKSLRGCYRTMVKNRELIEEEIYDEEEEQKKLKLISSPPVRKTGLFARRLWTASEKTAVYKGVQKHGAGHWKQIKEDEAFAEKLAVRTTVQIKDCYRSMKNRGEG